MGSGHGSHTFWNLGGGEGRRHESWAGKSREKKLVLFYFLFLKCEKLSVWSDQPVNRSDQWLQKSRNVSIHWFVHVSVHVHKNACINRRVLISRIRRLVLATVNSPDNTLYLHLATQSNLSLFVSLNVSIWKHYWWNYITSRRSIHVFNLLRFWSKTPNLAKTMIYFCNKLCIQTK